jgi:hypothetical protein
MSVVKVTGNQFVLGQSGDIFKLDGNGTTLGLVNNSGSKFILNGSNQTLNFADTDSNERVNIHGLNDAIQNSIVGISGTVTIRDFNLPGSTFSTPDELSKNALSSDGHGGTLLTLYSGAKIDFVHDRHVGVVSTSNNGDSVVYGNVCSGH